MVVAPPLSLLFVFLVDVGGCGVGRTRMGWLVVDGRTHAPATMRSAPRHACMPPTTASWETPTCLDGMRTSCYDRNQRWRSTKPKSNPEAFSTSFSLWGEETRTFAVDHVRRVVLVRERCGPPHVANAAATATARKRKGEEERRTKQETVRL